MGKRQMGKSKKLRREQRSVEAGMKNGEKRILEGFKKEKAYKKECVTK